MLTRARSFRGPSALTSAPLSLSARPRNWRLCLPRLPVSVAAAPLHATPSAAQAIASSSASPRTVKVNNLIELKHLLQCHTDKLVVLLCGFGERASQELPAALSAVARRHPNCLLLEMRHNGSCPAATFELNVHDVLASLEVQHGAPTFLVIKSGRLLERGQGGSMRQLCTNLDACLAAHTAAAAAPPCPQLARSSIVNLGATQPDLAQRRGR